VGPLMRRQCDRLIAGGLIGGGGMTRGLSEKKINKQMDLLVGQKKPMVNLKMGETGGGRSWGGLSV